MKWVRPLMASHYREEREMHNLFVCSKIKGTKQKGPTCMGQFAQCFKHVGTLIPRYIIIKYHFVTLEKIIYQK